MVLVLALTYLGACAAFAVDGREPATVAPLAAATTEYTPPKIQLRYRGVNLSGGEFGSKHPGTFGVDYTYPKNADVDYFANAGMNLVRLPFMWERLQRAQFAELSGADWTKIADLIAYSSSKGVTVVLEPHNSARYFGKLVGTQVPDTAFANFWGQVASRVKGNPRVMINLMNEPHDLPTEQWVTSANAAIVAIRSAGFTGTILVPGNAWTGAWHWASTWYGTPNAVAMLKIADPGKNMAFEVHQYLDANASGAGKECSSATAGVDRLKGFVAWLRKNNRDGFLGEFGAPNTALCKQAVDGLVAYVEKNYDVFMGWAWWSAGPWWPADYQLSLNPVDGGPRPQMQWLLPALPCAK